MVSPELLVYPGKRCDEQKNQKSSKAKKDTVSERQKRAVVNLVLAGRPSFLVCMPCALSPEVSVHALCTDLSVGPGKH